MNYLKHERIQKYIAAFFLTIMFAETVLPVQAWSKNNFSSDAHPGKAGSSRYRRLSGIGDVIPFAATTREDRPIIQKTTPSIPSSIAKKEKSSRPFIGGPGQPEMSTFKSANTDNMVDLFTGDFSYNIPLLDVGGYPVNIHYNGGPSIDQEASWVGLGWNINPGTINRSMRGLPDDYNGDDKISRIQHVKDNKTTGVGLGAGFEFFGGALGLNFNLGVFNNTYNGWGVESGVNANINAGSASKGSLTGSLGLNNNSQSGLNVNAGLSGKLGTDETSMNGAASLGANYNSRLGISGLQLNQTIGAKGISTTATSGLSFAVPSYTPTIRMPLTSTNFTFSGKYGGEIVGAFTSINISGYVSKQEIKDADTLQSLPGYGYLYFTNATDSAQALLDYNREKELYFNYKSTPHIAIPQYTYDVYSMSGEGTGGTFRPYRAEAGFIHDHAMQTKSGTDNFAINLGGGGVFKGGVDFNETIATTKSAAWRSDITPNLTFTNADSTYQPVYFRNPGEKTSNAIPYYQSVGGDSTVRIKLSGDGNNIKAANTLVAYGSDRLTEREINVAGPLLKKQRDKRTQVITYKTAGEASLYGLEKNIIYYNENTFPLSGCPDTSTKFIERADDVRKAHHLSEITVMNADGRRYIYGLPAYNVEQQDVTFSIDKETESDNLDRGIADYIPGQDNYGSTNRKGKDNFFTKDIMPPYAHSFLLTGLVSPDYVDITGDGITDDDLGDAVRFNYTMLYGKGKGYYSWRTPNEENKVNYSEGLKTYSRDDKGTYMFGKKEVWYLNSIASKTMIAVFKISSKREDDLGVNENGGINTGQKLRRLERIDLYSKSDLVKNGLAARPVKSVHFEYDYSLAKNAPNNSGNPVDKDGNAVSTGSSSNVNKNKGKLTLRKIWFSYNGNYKGVKNPYTFSYGLDDNGVAQDKYNPSHNSKNYDRWGTYKDPASNPGGLNNIDYPFAVQDYTKAAEYASAWNLTDIKLPSGGRMKISYEADDYAYVQDKRAMRLFRIAGFGSERTDQPKPLLYNVNTTTVTEYEFLFIDVSDPVIDKADIYRKYLEGVNKLYCRISVKMPPDARWGNGYEPVPVYFDIEPGNYGVVSGNNKRIWVKLAKVDNKNAAALAAIQFLRLNLPSKAYPTSEVGDDVKFADGVRMLVSSVSEIQNVVTGFYETSRIKGWCMQVDTAVSFARLNMPKYRKYGGGYRVKRVEIFDNWKYMTDQKEASYGQTYAYTTQKVITRDTLVSGTRKMITDTLTISSGVASYEPFIGAEENPFREPMEYEEKLAVLAPKNFLYSERPLGESFYPSAMVGYSKVTVRTIHTKAKSANGWQQTEFYTTKDFPTITDFTSFDGKSKRRYNPKLGNLLKLNAINNLTVSQGFKVELNDMNGKLKSQSNFAENDSINPFQYSRNYYQVDNDSTDTKHLNNKVWIVDSLNGHINTNGIIGQDIELLTDMREQYSVTYSKNYQFNLDAIPFITGTLPFISLFPPYQKEQNTFRSAATVKIIQRYGILDSVVVMDKGSVVSTKNMVYDGETGDPILTRTNNEFDDPVYQFNYPAYWAYSGMGGSYKNTDAVLTNKKVINGKMYNQDESDFNAAGIFESGDEIWVKKDKIDPVITSRPGDCPYYEFNTPDSNKRIWAIDAIKGKEKDRGIYFIDENGKPYHGMIDSMKIIRSGKRNMLAASAGNIVSLGNPVKEVSSGRFKIVIDSTIDIINTAATVYKDLWQVEKSYYVKDSIVRVYRDFPAIEVPASVYLARYDKNGRTGSPTEETIYPHSGFVTASMDYLDYCGNSHSNLAKTKSILVFDLDHIPVNAIVTSATISFNPKVPLNFWRRKKTDAGCSEPREGFDWLTATDFAVGLTNATLRRVTSKWNVGNWPYTSIIGATANGVSFNSSNYGTVACTGLMQDYIHTSIADRKRGIVFELNSVSNAGRNNEINYLSFCGEDRRSSTGAVLICNDNEKFPMYRSQFLITPEPNTDGCDYCSGPTLTLNYKAYVDSLVKLCKENISDTAANPYRWGILGNWRVDRAYTYYSDRKENDASVLNSNIRKEGVLKNFTPYWYFSDSVLVAAPDTNKWVWNAASSMYNKRGFEIENYDPLGIYNAGLYGYNQTMPVAIARNSQYREILYDGFEDYDFRNEACTTLCEKPREFDFIKNQSGVAIDSSESHTGKYSVRIDANASSVFTAMVEGKDSLATAVSALVDSIPVYTKTVVGSDTTQGLSAVYNLRGCSAHAQKDPGINFNWGYAPPVFVPGCPVTDFSASWVGSIQPKYNGKYTFYITQSGYLTISIAGVTKTIFSSGTIELSTPTSLTAGQLYPVFIFYVKKVNTPSYLKLEWESATQTREIIPGRFLYSSGVTSAPAASIVQNIQTYCIALNNVRGDSVIRPAFKPIRGKKLVISGWLKIENAECDTSASPANVISVGFKQGGSLLFDSSLAATGVRIEHWQRYEKIITVPANATQVLISLKAPPAKIIYVDDLRVQPYNSSMKSFAYDDVSLRLMAELDENNYASFYEYDNDGTLIRVKKETERGIKTIKETRSALIKDEN